MNNFYWALLALATTSVTTSCFKDEPLNAECDIRKAELHSQDDSKTFYNASDKVIEVPYSTNKITFNVRRGADVSHITPTFLITPGATISPKSGVEQNFNNGPITYTVTSEDGHWTRTYNIGVSSSSIMENDTVTFDFEHYELEDSEQKYYVWHNEHEDGTLGDWWATGNPGFRVSMGSAKPDEYPTAPYAFGVKGAGVALVTRSTGPFGVMVKKPIAAGNLFLGSFNLKEALSNAMLATNFGVKFNKKPMVFTGYYQYKPGEKYIDRQQHVVEGVTDSPDIYAVFYKNEDENGKPVMLHGDDVKTNKNIIAIAEVENAKPTDKWTEFKVEFNYTSEIDLDMLAERKYNLAIVFSSSKRGAHFEGAIGSTLLIDNIKIICKQEKK